MKFFQNPALWWLSLAITALMTLTSLAGLLLPWVYAQETKNWWAQCLGQDYSNLLFIGPALLFSGWKAAKGGKGAFLFWMGVLSVQVYSFVLYSFCVHFNGLFLLYCLILGLSLWSLFWGLYQHRQTDFQNWFSSKIPHRPLSVLLLTLAGLFAFLWLSEALPASLANQTPPSVLEAGLLTNPVHVLDFTFYLPAMVLAGLGLWKKSPLGLAGAPVMLVFGLGTAVNIASLMTVSSLAGITQAWGGVAVMGAVGLICALGTRVLLRQIRNQPPA